MNLREKNSLLAAKKEKLVEVLEEEISRAKFMHKENALIHRELIEQNVQFSFNGVEGDSSIEERVEGKERQVY